MALNLYTQGIDPGLDLSQLMKTRTIYENLTGMQVGERMPYSGDLVFTAFSGSHQDAIKKGFDYRSEHALPVWNMPYLVVDPTDIGRSYEPIIRINSQSGKGGAAYIPAPLRVSPAQEHVCGFRRGGQAGDGPSGQGAFRRPIAAPVPPGVLCDG